MRGTPRKIEHLRMLIADVLLIAVLGAQPLAVAASSGADCILGNLSQSLARGLTLSRLSAEIATRRARVPEFEFIRKEAEKRGLRVWLFGGTAAGYSHYVQWYLLREAGDLRFQKARFDYDYTNIYRSTQDLDIVVDGSAQHAQEFQQVLKTMLPYFVGSKATPWEVRSLREASYDKGAILDDFGFMNQHTDSNSTGMVELTNPPKGESVVRDIRDWKNSQNSQFLKDVHEDKLTYYSSPTHDQTQRAKEGKNPPIFSVVRALTKAFQYDLKIRPEDLAVMKREIDQFSAARDLQNPDAQRWLEKNGKKLYQHAENVKYASETLEKLGLKQKLIAIKNNADDANSLSWWMSKEPLKSSPVGAGLGRTAKDLGIDTVAHETKSFVAYESITLSHAGEPNIFISRNGVKGELAEYENGFYTAIGRKGASGSGITIRFKADPNAVEGKDFSLAKESVREGASVIWHNKNAIRVIPESLELSPSQYFEFLAEGKEISEDDKVLIWKLKRKLEHSMTSALVDPTEQKKTRDFVIEQMKTKAPHRELVFSEWLKFEGVPAGISSKKVDSFVESFKTGLYRVDPAATVGELIRLSRGTKIEEWINHEFVPSLLTGIKLDIGEQAIENSLTSSHSEIRKFGLRALAYAEKTRPSNRIAMYRKLINAHRGDQPIDRLAAQAWLRSDLERNSLLPLFEKIAEKDAAALALLRKARAESFQFQAFDIPSGGKKVMLGSPVSEAGRSSDEPIREVILTKPFEMQLTPVTQLQWLTMMGENPANFSHGGEVLNGIAIRPDRPIENVSWNDAQEFIKKLNRLDPNYNYRLLTEAEWEAAARAGTSTAYSFGDDAADLFEYGWHRESSGGHVHDVASLKPNPMGLHDMHGDVWEWVQDRSNGFDPPPGGIDPLGDIGSKRVLRGGAWNGVPQNLRSSYRFFLAPDDREYSIGFRMARFPKHTEGTE